MIGAIADVANANLDAESMKNLLIGLGIFSLCLVAIAAAAYIAKKALVGMVALIAVVVVITGMFLLLSTIDTNAFLAMAIGLSAALVAISIAMAVISAIPVAAAAQGVAGLAIFVGGLTAVLVALGGLAQIDGFTWLIEEGTEVLALIGKALGEFVGNLIGGTLGTIASYLPDIATDLSLFMTNLQPFLDGANSITKDMIDGVLGLCGVIIALTAAELIDGVAKFFGGDTNFAEFGKQLADFAPYVVEFANIVSEVEPEALTTAADAAASLAQFAAAIPNSGGLLGALAGENDLSTWGPQLPEFAGYLVEFSDAVSGESLDVEAIKNAAEAGKAIAEMASTLPNQGGVAAWFAGENSMEVIGPQLGVFADGILEFSKAVSGESFNKDAILTACEAGKAIADMASKLPNQGGVASWFAGENSLEVIGPQLVDFGKDIKSFNDAIQRGTGIDENKVMAAIRCGKSIANMAASLPNQGGVAAWFSGDNTLSTFGEEIASYGSKLKTFHDNIDGINFETLSSAITGMERIVNFAKTLKNFDKSKVTDFASSMEELGKANVSKFMEAFENAESDIGPAIDTFLRTISGTIRSAYSELFESGKESLNKYCDGIIQNKNRAMVSFKTVLESTTSVFDGYRQTIFGIGMNFCLGIANGIYMNQYAVTNASIATAQSIIDAAQNTLKMHSPSKIATWMGKYWDTSLANSMLKYSYTVSNASSQVSNEVLAYIGDVQTAINSIDFSNAEPSVSPVVDLSRVRSGVSNIAQIMNGTASYAISSNIAKERAELNKRTNTIKVESTSKDVVAAIGNLESRIDDLGDRISRMSVTLDKKTVVGELTDPMDKSLGNKAAKNNARKGVVVGRLV